MKSLNTRIRYTEQPNGTMVSESFVSTTLNDTLTVVLTLSELHYSVVKGNGSVLEEGKGNSLPDLKKRVKKVLTSNGVSFYKEYRQKRVKTEQAA